jgi:hypothetical protein
MKKWGIFVVIGAMVLAFSISGCGGGGGGGGGGGDLIVMASVSYDDVTGTVGAAIIYQGGFPGLGGTPVTDATVTIDGTNIPHIGLGTYQATFASAFTVGYSISLEVQKGGSTYTANVTMPDQPSLSEPTAGVKDPGSDLAVVWTIGASPDGYEIEVYDEATKSNVEYEDDDLGSALLHTIPGGSLPTTSTPLVAGVAAVNITTISGLDMFSAFSAQSLGESASFTTQ